MSESKEFYKTYQADPEILPLAEEMFTMIRNDGCVHAFEMGCGEGKNLRRLNAKGIATFGMDISILNVFRAQSHSQGIALGDENYLRHFANFDCVFTISVLDHIEFVDDIILEFKRIANKVVYLLETNEVPGKFYYPHHYESYGFKKISNPRKSAGDGAEYFIWVWYK